MHGTDVLISTVSVSTIQVFSFNLSYADIWDHGMPYIPVDHLTKNWNKKGKIYDVKPVRSKALNYIKTERPNITLFFSRSIHVYSMWNKNYSGVSAPGNFTAWKLMIRDAFLDFIPTILPYTTPIFAIEHPHTLENPKSCIKKLQNEYNDWQNYTQKCNLTLEYDKGVKYLRDMLAELQETFIKIKFIELGSMLFRNFFFNLAPN